MTPDEDAAITYEPEDHGGSDLGAALAEAERTLSRREGINGMGLTRTPGGQDAIVVYVTDRPTLSRLPASVRGIPVVGEITGDIRAL